MCPLRPALGCAGVYFVVCMALLVLSLAETILIVRLVHKQELQRPVPAWLRRLAPDRLVPPLCRRGQSASPRPPTTSQATKTDDCSGEKGRGDVLQRDLDTGPWWGISGAGARDLPESLGRAWGSCAVLHTAPSLGGGALQPKALTRPCLRLHHLSSARGGGSPEPRTQLREPALWAGSGLSLRWSQKWVE